MNLVYIHVAQKKFSIVQASRLYKLFDNIFCVLEVRHLIEFVLQLNILPWFSQDNALTNT